MCAISNSFSITMNGPYMLSLAVIIILLFSTKSVKNTLTMKEKMTYMQIRKFVYILFLCIGSTCICWRIKLKFLRIVHIHIVNRAQKYATRIRFVNTCKHKGKSLKTIYRNKHINEIGFYDFLWKLMSLFVHRSINRNLFICATENECGCYWNKVNEKNQCK